MQWTMWSKSWVRKAKRRSYHHSKKPSWMPACLTYWSRMDPFPSQQGFDHTSMLLSGAVRGEQAQNCSGFILSPTSNMVISL